MGHKTRYIFWGKAVTAALLLVFVVRTCWVESFVISSSQMENSLHEGDRVIVDKTAYGLRLPMTLFSVPFTFDKLFGWQSYSPAVVLPYVRIGGGVVPVNDIVLYNHPLQTSRPLDKRMLCVARCVAQPGDSLVDDGETMKVNGHTYPPPPDRTGTFRFPARWADTIRQAVRHLQLPLKTVDIKGDSCLVDLNRLDAYLLKSYLPDSLWAQASGQKSGTYRLVVPRRGMKLTISPPQTDLYAYLIEQEQGAKISVAGGKTYLGGRLLTHYTFTDNYYWLLSDNAANAVDSHRLGFVSEKNIIGKVAFVWWHNTQR